MFRKLHDPAPGCEVTVDGVAHRAEPGESVAAVLLRCPPYTARTTPVGGAARGPYCMMGVCFDCLAEVDGVPSVQTCLTPVRAGMRIVRQHGRRSLA
jgi:D-hydroxyproline dehydrogenase subunit gamma